jgi:hypothetical protein
VFQCAVVCAALRALGGARNRMRQPRTHLDVVSCCYCFALLVDASHTYLNTVRYHTRKTQWFLQPTIGSALLQMTQLTSLNVAGVRGTLPDMSHLSLLTELRVSGMVFLSSQPLTGTLPSRWPARLQLLYYYLFCLLCW